MSCLQRCVDCPNVREPVPGDGPLNSEIMWISEHPGAEEDKRGIPFCGRIGKELNRTYFPLAGIDRDSTYVTNVVKCWPQFDRHMSDDIIGSCAGLHLRQEIFAIKPKMVVLMGAVACNLAGVDVHLHHGRPMMVDILGYRTEAFIMYHPALGLHDNAAMKPIMDDFIAFNQYRRTGVCEIPVDRYPKRMYERLRTAEEVETSFLFRGPKSRYPIAIDTEYDPLPVGVNPYCLTYSHTPGSGSLIKAEDTEAIKAFARVIAAWRGVIVMHNALADLPPLEGMGIRVDEKRVRDTMIMLYELADQPKALKTAAYRLAGMIMTEFDDLVTPYAVEHWLAYMEVLSTYKFEKPEPYMRLVPEKVVIEVDGLPITVGKEMVEKLYKPQSLSTKVKRLLTDYRKNPGPKVFKRWGDWEDREKEPAIALLGDMPRKSIRMVSDEQALLDYACADADSTLRIYPILKQMHKDFRRKNNI